MAGLDPVIHAPRRLEICAFLSPLEDAEFQTVRAALDVSDSVLSKHVSRLEDAGYVAVTKKPLAGRQRTWLSLTRAGRNAFAEHHAALRALLDRSAPGLLA